MMDDYVHIISCSVTGKSMVDWCQSFGRRFSMNHYLGKHGRFFAGLVQEWQLIWCVVFSTYNIPPLTNIKNMFGNWLNSIDKKTKARILVLAFQLSVGPFGIVETIRFLTDLQIFISCSLFIWQHIGYNFGRISYPRTSENLCYWVCPAPDGRTRLVFPG